MENQINSESRIEKSDDGSITIEGQRFVPDQQDRPGEQDQNRQGLFARLRGTPGGDETPSSPAQISENLQAIDADPANKDPFTFARSIFDPENEDVQPAELWKIEQPKHYL